MERAHLLRIVCYISQANLHRLLPWLTRETATNHGQNEPSVPAEDAFENPVNGVTFALKTDV